MTNAGSALAPGELQVIFEPLVQLASEGPNPRPATNLGLGLFIARQIVLAHGGTIEATSSTKEGTTFSIVLMLTCGHWMGPGQQPGGKPSTRGKKSNITS